MVKQNSSRQLLKLLHKLTCYATTFGLLVPTSNVFATTKMDAVNAGLNAVNEIGNMAMQQYMQLQQQNMANQQIAAQMQSLSSPKPIPAKFFNDPNFHFCYTAPAKTAFPDGACEGPISDDLTYQQSEMFRQYSLIHIEFYDQLISEAQNQAYPKGVQCLEEGRKVFENKMQDKINHLTALQDEIKKQQQLFKEQNDKLKKEMADLNTELTGGSSSSIKDQKREFKNYFSPDCQNIIGAKALSSAAANGGLIGIQKGMSSNVQAATNFSTNKNSIEREINKSIQDVKKDYQKYGTTGLTNSMQSLAGKPGVGKKIAGLMSSEAKKLEAAFTNAQTAINEANPSNKNYKIPKPDKHFAKNLQNFKNNISNQVKKDYINGCVTGAENGVGLSLDQVISSMRYRGTGRGAGAVKNYEVALQSILNDSTLTPEQKMAKIQSIDNGSVVLSYKSMTGSTQTVTPYEYFQTAVTACESKFESNSSSGDLASAKDKLDTMNSYIDDLIKLEKTFMSDFANEVTDQLINCDGAALEANTCSPDGSIFNPSTPSFCVKHADQCSSKVQACYASANQIVEQKTAQLNTMGAKYNQQMTQMVAAMDQKLKQIKQAVVADAEFLKQYFGQSFELPSDLFVKMPEMAMSDEFGIEVIGGGDTNFLEELPGKIEDLKALLAEQKQNVDQNVLQPYIDQQKQALAMNKSKWEGLLQSCKQKVSAYHDGMAQQMQQAQAAQAEGNAQVSNACNQIKMFGSSPLAFCEGGNTPTSLSETMSDVLSAGMNQEMALINQQFVSLCNQHQNEVEEGSRREPASALATSCINKSSWTAVKKDLMNSVASNLPLDLQEDKDAILDFVFKGKGKLPKIEDAELKENLVAMKESIEKSKSKDYYQPVNFDDLVTDTCSDAGDDKSSCEKKMKMALKEADVKGSITPENPCDDIRISAKYNALTDIADEVSTNKNYKSSRLKKDYNEYFDQNIKSPSGKTQEMAGLFDTSLDGTSNLQWQRLGQRAQNIGCFQGNNASRGFQGFGPGAGGEMPGMGGFNGLTRQ